MFLEILNQSSSCLTYPFFIFSGAFFGSLAALFLRELAAATGYSPTAIGRTIRGSEYSRPAAVRITQFLCVREEPEKFFEKLHVEMPAAEDTYRKEEKVKLLQKLREHPHFLSNDLGKTKWGGRLLTPLSKKHQ